MVASTTAWHCREVLIGAAKREVEPQNKDNLGANAVTQRQNTGILELRDLRSGTTNVHVPVCVLGYVSIST